MDAFFRFITPNMRTNQGKVEWKPLNHEALVRLIALAETAIFDAMQATEDEAMDQRVRREEKSVNHGKQEVRHTGKTARNRAKKASHA